MGGALCALRSGRLPRFRRFAAHLLQRAVGVSELAEALPQRPPGLRLAAVPAAGLRLRGVPAGSGRELVY
jgi:hypothetical protein